MDLSSLVEIGCATCALIKLGCILRVTRECILFAVTVQSEEEEELDGWITQRLTGFLEFRSRDCVGA